MASAPELIDRRSDLDAVRALAMLLGIALHGALAYVGGFWIVNDQQQAPLLGLLVAGVHGFRMPMFFLLSGFFSAMLWSRRGTAGLASHRARRILLPLVLSCVTILPIMHGVTRWAMAAQNATAESASKEPPRNLWEAAAAGDLDAIRRFAATMDKLDGPDPKLGVTAMAWAAITDKPQAVELLIELGADPNATNWDGNTPLHAACFLGRESIARKLLDAGANAELKGREGARPADVMNRDEATTRSIATTLRIPFDFERISAGRERIRAMLGEPSTTANNPKPNSESPTTPRSSEGPAWLSHLRSETLLAHLWFLWFLCFYNVGFLAVAVCCRLMGGVRVPAWLFGLPTSLVWVVPITMMVQSFMHDRGTSPGFGPDTSAGLVPALHVLAYYGIFFGFGALLFVARGQQARVGRLWWVALACALVLLPLALAFAYNPRQASAWVANDAARGVLSNLLEVLYAWLATFGMIGLCERVLARPRAWVRYLAESSYWLYLTHLPLVIALQAALRGWEASSPVKFVVVVVVTTGVLLGLYHLAVRRTVVGRILNGSGVPGR